VRSLKLATSPIFASISSMAFLVPSADSRSYFGNASITSSRTSRTVFPSDDFRPVSIIQTQSEPVGEKSVEGSPLMRLFTAYA